MILSADDLVICEHSGADEVDMHLERWRVRVSVFECV